MREKVMLWFARRLSMDRSLIQQVLVNNAERALRKERERVRIATQGLNQIIADVARADWQPGIDEVAGKAIVAAENALHEMESL